MYEPKTEEEKRRFEYYQKTCDMVMESLAVIMRTDDIRDLGSV